jgi:hypothetical protein
MDVSKEDVLEINVEKTKYMLLSCHQNAVQNRDIKIADRSFENVSQFKYLGTTVTNQNFLYGVMHPVARIIKVVSENIKYE